MTDWTDEHADVRFFKLVEVAYNSARNNEYEVARDVMEIAVSHYDRTGGDGE